MSRFGYTIVDGSSYFASDVRLRDSTAITSLTQYIAGACAITPGHRASKPLAVKACLTAGEVRNAISALAASACLLPELTPATYTE